MTIILERKTMKDLAASIKDGRYKEQKARMLAAITQYRPNMLNHNLCNSHTNVSESLINKKKLIKVIDFLGKELKINTSNKNCIYIYNDGSVEKKIILK